MRLLRNLVLLCPILAPSAPAQEAPLSTEDVAERVEAFVAPFVADGHVSGTVLVARGDEVLFHRSYGQANREHGVPNRPETRFGIASITKPMTVVIAVRLMEAGELRLDDPIATWLPDFPRAERITVEHLLRHRAGIPHRVTTEAEESMPRTAQDMVDLAARVLADDSRFLCEPGAVSNYSSAGYSILARVLELASGKSYAELLDEHVVEPAGLERTTHTSGRVVLKDRAQGYMPGSRGVLNAPLKDLSFLVGAGSVYSTAHDLFLFMKAVREGAYGEGVRASLTNGDGMGSNGVTNGFRAFCDHDARTGISVAVVSNLTTGALDRLRETLPVIAAGGEFEIPERLALEPADVPREVLEGYAGTYEPRPGGGFDVRVEDGELMIGSYVLVPLGDDRFFSIQDYAAVNVVRDEDGGITGLDWSGLVMNRVAD